MRKYKKEFFIVGILCLVLFLGSTISYFFIKDAVPNIFRFSIKEMIKAEIIEPHWKEESLPVLPGTILAKDPQVQNIGSRSIVVRMHVVERWTPKDGQQPAYFNPNYVQYNQQSLQEEPVFQLLNDYTSTSWIKGNNWNSTQFGYFYYKDMVDVNKVTLPLFQSIKVRTAEDILGLDGENLSDDEILAIEQLNKQLASATLDIILYMEILDAADADSIQAFWGNDIPDGVNWSYNHEG